MEQQGGLGVGDEPIVPRLEGHYLSQVLTVHPEDHAVSVILPALSGLRSTPFIADEVSGAVGLKARVLQQRAGPWFGHVDLPRVGDWGLVVFPHGTHDYVVWLGCLYQDFNHLGTGPAKERTDTHDSGVWSRIDEQGQTEWVHPSGTYLRVGTGTDITKDATTNSERTRYERHGRTKRKVAYPIPLRSSPTMFIKHTSGLTVEVDPDGNITIFGPANKTTTIIGNVLTTIHGWMTANVTGNVTITTENDALVSAQHDATVSAVNKANVTGDTVNVNAQGDCTIDAVGDVNIKSGGIIKMNESV